MEGKIHQIDFLAFNNLDDFSQAIEKATGLVFDVQSVVGLDTDFAQGTDRYLFLNIKDYSGEQPDNLLFLTSDISYVFSKKLPSPEETETFEDVLSKPFGKSTVLTFFVLDKVQESHKRRLESYIKLVKQLEDNFDLDQYRNLTMEFARLYDRLEDFNDLLLRLQERHYKQMETQLIAFDYRLLTAESESLQGRCRRRLAILRELRQEHEMQATEELNQRIIKLNDVVKRLTALTVILMIPTLIASHFGMNFAFMPELEIPWVYPAVIVFQFATMGLGFAVFRKLGWL
ncbi:MAG: CorA family divalent cation transporter [Chloroflexota bacterium]